ncbi:MAG: hypothetical protein ACRENL_00100 [Candidatus Dormibacteria bacterium]
MTAHRPDFLAAAARFDDSRAGRRPGLSFDRVPRDYDRSRPQYPPELVAHACAVAGLAPVIGCSKSAAAAAS